MEILFAFLVFFGVAAWLSHVANKSKPGSRTRKTLRKLDIGSAKKSPGRKSGASEPKRSEGIELTVSVEDSYGGSDSYEKIEREASKRAFSRGIPETLDEYTREQLAGAWMRDRRSGGDLVSGSSGLDRVTCTRPTSPARIGAWAVHFDSSLKARYTM